MTNEQILKLFKDILKLASEHLRYFEDGWRGTEWSGKPENLLRFARAIRKETIEEVLTLLKDVPNPEANRTAINRIMSMNND
jgi:hypothetical protein